MKVKILPRLKIGKLTPRLPLIQGGMAFKVSTGRLAGSVAREGGIGLIAGTGMTPDELREEIKIARSIANGGIVGINTMVAVSAFMELMKTAAEAGIDMLVAGAGFSKDIFAIGREYNIPVVPIVSTDKAAKLSEKLGASAVIVEGSDAGGHLGSDRPARTIFPEVRAAVKIPVILAGGMIEQKDVVEAYKMGADGVQVGTRFAASFEANVTKPFHDTYLKAKEGDVFRILSPVGLHGNALPTPFSKRAERGEVKITEACLGCLKKCSRRFCIARALIAAKDGDLENGLVFAGENVYRINEILSVEQIMHNFFDGLEYVD